MRARGHGRLNVAAGDPFLIPYRSLPPGGVRPDPTPSASKKSNKRPPKPPAILIILGPWTLLSSRTLTQCNLRSIYHLEAASWSHHLIYSWVLLARPGCVPHVSVVGSLHAITLLTFALQISPLTVQFTEQSSAGSDIALSAVTGSLNLQIVKLDPVS